MDQLTGICQMEGTDDFARKRWPPFLFDSNGRIRRLYRARRLLEKIEAKVRSHGFLFTLKKSVMVLANRVVGQTEAQSAGTAKAAVLDKEILVLNLQPGEWVEVKSLQDIMDTLDEKSKCQGLEFTSEMVDYCGTRQRVFRRMELLFNEYTHEHRKMKNTVLLEGVYCRGTGFGCDRHCFHFWREAWLRRTR